MSISKPFTRFAAAIAHTAGKPMTFAICCLLVIVWAVSGPLFGFSDTWQLVINTSTTIITFLMVFVLQNTQERDGEAVQAKLDELIFAVKGADNRFVQAEKLTDHELHKLRERLLAQCEAASQEIERRGARAGKPREPA